MPNPHAPYPPAFKTEAVRLVHSGDKSIAAIALDLGVSDPTLRSWVQPGGDRRRDTRRADDQRADRTGPTAARGACPQAGTGHPKKRDVPVGQPRQ